jgi:nitrogen fixation/metabolism regulation signal transduction histidine kinase
MELKNLRRFIVAQGVLVLLLVGTAFFTAANLNRSLAITIDLTSLQEVVQAADVIEAALEEERIAIGQYPLTGNDELLTRISNAQEEYDQAWAVIVRNSGQEQAQLIANIEAGREEYKGKLEGIVSEYQSNPAENTSAALLPDAINFYLQYLDPKFADLSEPELQRLAAQVEIEKTRATTLSIFSMVALVFSIVVGIAVIFQVGAAVIFSRRMIDSIDEIVNAANAISRGDMDVPIETGQGGEIGQLAASIDRMRTSLKAAIERLRRTY